jgi:uncharacterized damage-inducible protein DinB
MAPLDRALLEWNLQPQPGRRSWHGGPTPVGALRGVTAEQARWAPTPSRKSIWQLTLHVAYWKYAVRRHLKEEPIARFPRKPANWPSVAPTADAAAWARDVALLKDEHLRLLEALRRVRRWPLDRIPPEGRRWTYGELLLGIAAHDAYHTGQIQLLKRLWQERARLGRRA